jgi:hypothetical protein
LKIAREKSNEKFTTPNINESAPKSERAVICAERAEEKTTFPPWAKVLHALHKIKNDVSKYEKLIKQFLYEYFGKSQTQSLNTKPEHKA